MLRKKTTAEKVRRQNVSLSRIFKRRKSRDVNDEKAQRLTFLEELRSKGEIIEIDASNYEDVVDDEGRDVFVEFYETDALFSLFPFLICRTRTASQSTKCVAI